MPSLDTDDIAEALQTAAYACRKAASYGSNVPRVAGEKAVRNLKQRLATFLREMPGDLTINELRELLGPNPTTETHGDDE